MTTQVNSIDELQALIGTHVGYGEYLTVTQEAVNQFADATGDHQWIHVDPVRAAAGPFGGPIAHGYMTLSLIPVLLNGVMQVAGVKMGVNYGTNKVRFTSPVPVGYSNHNGGWKPVHPGEIQELDYTADMNKIFIHRTVKQINDRIGGR